MSPDREDVSYTLVKEMFKAVEDRLIRIEAQTIKTNGRVDEVEGWVAVREDREKRTGRIYKFLGAVTVAFSTVAATALFYLVLHVK